MDQPFAATDFEQVEGTRGAGREECGFAFAVRTRIPTPQTSKKAKGQHADRNAQFERITELKEEYLAAGNPVISIDTKKKEMLGNFHRDGVTDAVEPTIVNDHDFASCSDGKVILHGIYDIHKNKASLHLNGSRDTTQFACESIALWWREQGQHDYPDADEVLILCDGGGSNSSSAYIFKEDLQTLSNRLSLKIRIAHYPPYCSKYNPSSTAYFLTSREPAKASPWKPSKRRSTTWRKPKQRKAGMSL